MYGFRDEMYGFRDEMYGFRDEMYGFRDNVVYDRKNAAMIQEKSDAEYFRQHIAAENPTLNIELYTFGFFYDINGDIITDIDGCIAFYSMPQKPDLSIFSKNNSIQISNIRNGVFFIESKNLLDKVNFDNKIIQFIKMLNIVKTIKNVDVNNVAADFKNMITTHPLQKNPSETYFIFSANDLSLHIRKLIIYINEGTLTEEIYKKYIYKMFIEHSMYKRIGNIIKHKPNIKKLYMKASTFDDFINLFQNPIFKIHSTFLQAFFINYTSVYPLYSQVKGLLGCVYYGDVYLPPRF